MKKNWTRYDELGAPDYLLSLLSGDADELSVMAKQTRTLISTVGPCPTRHTGNRSVVQQRAPTTATSPVKRSGWRSFSNASTRLLRPAVHDSIHCCGFDSVPSDLSVFFLQKHFKERFRTLRNASNGPHGESRRRRWWHGSCSDVCGGAGIEEPHDSRTRDGPLGSLPGRH